MKRYSYLIVLTFFYSSVVFAQTDEDQIKAVITSAYVNGIHNGGPIADIKTGFHQGFKMMVLANDNVREVSRDGWIKNIEASRQKNPDADRPKSVGEFERVTVTGTNATVELHLMRNGRKVFTDNLALYKFSDGWKIVSKTFYSHPRP